MLKILAGGLTSMSSCIFFFKQRCKHDIDSYKQSSLNELYLEYLCEDREFVDPRHSYKQSSLNELYIVLGVSLCEDR